MRSEIAHKNYRDRGLQNLIFSKALHKIDRFFYEPINHYESSNKEIITTIPHLHSIDILKDDQTSMSRKQTSCHKISTFHYSVIHMEREKQIRGSTANRLRCTANRLCISPTSNFSLVCCNDDMILVLLPCFLDLDSLSI